MFKKQKNNEDDLKVIIREGEEYKRNRNQVKAEENSVKEKISEEVQEELQEIIEQVQAPSVEDRIEETVIDITDEDIEKQKATQKPQIGEESKVSFGYVKVVVVIISVAMLMIVLIMGGVEYIADSVSDWIDVNVIGTPEGDGFPFELTDSKTNAGNIVSVDGDIAILGSTNFKIINSTGAELESFAHSYANPILENNGDTYFIYSSGDKYYSIVYDDKITKYDAGNVITTAAVGGNSRYIVATQASDYTSRISVYLYDGTLKYTYDFAYGYVTAVGISDSGSQGVVSYVTSEDGVLYSHIVVLDFTKTEPIYEYVSEDNLIVDVQCVSGDVFYLIGDTAMVCYENGKFSSFDYGGKQVTAYAGNEDKVVISLASYLGFTICDLYVFDPNADTYVVQSSGSVSSISIYGSTFSVLADNMVYSYDINGSLAGYVDVGYNAYSITLMNESSVYVLAARQIKLEYIK